MKGNSDIGNGHCASEWGGRVTGRFLFTDDEVLALIAAERERCAKLCDALTTKTETRHKGKMVSSIESLAMRFDKMAEVRERHAAKKRADGSGGETPSVLESAAAAYRRCADEARRVANGETPAEPGYRWD